MDTGSNPVGSTEKGNWFNTDFPFFIPLCGGVAHWAGYIIEMTSFEKMSSLAQQVMDEGKKS